MDVRRIVRGVTALGVVAAVSCGPGSDPPVETTSSTTSTSSSTASTAPTTSTSPGTTVASTDTTTTTTTTLGDTTETLGTTVGAATLGTTTEDPPPPPPDCQTVGCEDPSHWCVIFETIEDTDGSDSITAECLPFPPRCEGLTDQELELCLEPLCCMNYGCVWSLDVDQMQFVCHTDPGVICGDACS